jgi:dihydrofolate reductase
MVECFDEALAAARQQAGDGGVAIGGGADTIRRALAAEVVDELGITTAPVVLGRGKRLSKGSTAMSTSRSSRCTTRRMPSTSGTPSGADSRRARRQSTRLRA